MEPTALQQKLTSLSSSLDERSRRLVFAAEARSLGRGGIALVHRATGMARSTLERGIRELENPLPKDTERIRRPGGGRKRLVDKDPAIWKDLEALVEPTTRGDPECSLRWTCNLNSREISSLRSG